MYFKKYEDFVNEDNLIIYSFEEDGTINEKSEPFIVDTEVIKPKVGIICPTYNIDDNNRGRGNYINFKSMITAMITGLQNQSHENWKLFIMGDCFQPEEELIAILKDKLKPSQYTFFNLKEPGERGKVPDDVLRNSAGTAALNKGISLAKSEGFEYLAHIDHDDVWKPAHLELGMRAFQQDPDIAFVYTRGSKARSKGKGTGVYYWGKEYSKPVIFTEDLPGEIIGASHSSLMYHAPTCGWIKGRTVPEMKSTAPKRPKEIGGDEDFIRRCLDNLMSKSKKVAYMPTLTVRLRNAKGKLPS
jgi:glycosyltransferase involved in cell wall biosynthesis